jgi:hypothetical protein
MRMKLGCVVFLALVVTLSSGCSSSIQTDKSIKEERSSSAETGPVLVKAVIRMNDGTPMRKREFHLVTISRDDKGDMNQVQQLFSITGETDENGKLEFQLPREKMSGVKEFSLGLNSSNPYGAPLLIRRKDAKEILSFKADEKTKSVDLGDVVIPLG